jgi:CheY-like chemotaxis protein
MSENKLIIHPYAYGTIVEDDTGVSFSIRMGHPIFKTGLITQSFAYVMVVEPDDAIREAILRTVTTPNCAVDMARDEDEAVAKAVQHHPQLIIVKQHEPLDPIALKQPFSSIASRICHRAQLNKAVRLVTHSDAAIALRAKTKSLTLPARFIIVRLVFKSQPGRKEWYSNCANDLTAKFLSDHIPFWLGRGRIKSPPFPEPNYSDFKPFVRSDRIDLN